MASGARAVVHDVGDPVRVRAREHAPAGAAASVERTSRARVAEALRATPSHRILVESERHAAVARGLADAVPGLAGNLFHAFHTAVLMREHGIARVYTRDADFRRFGFLEVIDPLA